MPPEIAFKTGRTRPTKLANKNCCYSNSDLRQIDLKPESELEWQDFDVIFAISGCTAAFDEQGYNRSWTKYEVRLLRRRFRRRTGPIWRSR